MKPPERYTTQLQAGTGLIEETQLLLSLWEPGMTANALYKQALVSGEFANVTARRLRNIVIEGFAPRFLNSDPQPAPWLKTLQRSADSLKQNQLFYLYTARANLILRDFVSDVYWDRYASGYSEITKNDAVEFVERATRDGKTQRIWADSTIQRISSYLLSACVDFNLLRPSTRTSRQITPIHMDNRTAIFLACELHFSGVADNNLVNHADWQLFGMDPEDVRDRLSRLSVHKFWIYQSAINAVTIGWNHQNMEEVIDVIIEAGL